MCSEVRCSSCHCPIVGVRNHFVIYARPFKYSRLTSQAQIITPCAPLSFSSLISTLNPALPSLPRPNCCSNMPHRKEDPGSPLWGRHQNTETGLHITASLTSACAPSSASFVSNPSPKLNPPPSYKEASTLPMADQNIQRDMERGRDTTTYHRPLDGSGPFVTLCQLSSEGLVFLFLIALLLASCVMFYLYLRINTTVCPSSMLLSP